MLLEFRTQNYKSFLEEVSFSMLAAPKQKGLDYSVYEKKDEFRCLCSSVIYGPNAAGKSNIIGAIDTFRAIVLRGHIRNIEEQLLQNPAASALELIPNNALTEPVPTKFYIDFYEQRLRVQYSVSLDLGLFLKDDYPRRVLEEEFFVNGIRVFHRSEKDGLTLEQGDPVAPYLLNTAPEEGETGIARNTLNDTELFLTHGFKLIYAPALVGLILNWFDNKLETICRADAMQLNNHYSNPQKNMAYMDKTTAAAVKLFGVNANPIGYVFNSDNNTSTLCSLFEHLGKIGVPADLFESYGTIRFVNLFPLIAKALDEGGTLIVDEFDASIHPMALMSILNLFHNDDVNKNHAQLIFNTQNPIFLNPNLLRRDEIKFVERDDDSHLSSLYALSDFGTAGKGGVRQHEDYMKHYFVGRYGAIRDIDFAPVIEAFLDRKEEDQP